MRLARVVLSVAVAALLPLASPADSVTPEVQPADTDAPDARPPEDVPHSRHKRVLWITNDGRLALPPGTTMVITPSISMPLVRYPPHGFLSNITVSFPFTIDFDKLGLTDNENPFGTLPPLFDARRSFGRAAGAAAADFLARYLERRRGRRDAVPDPAPDPRHEEAVLDRMHGGERAILYGLAEDMLANFGWEGRECLLRAICEVHAHPLTNFGFLGEVMRLFFTPSKSPYAHLLPEYMAAQRAGEGRGECFPYYRDCPRSIFLPSTNKYSKEAEDLHRREQDTETDTNEIKAM